MDIASFKDQGILNRCRELESPKAWESLKKFDEDEARSVFVWAVTLVAQAIGSAMSRVGKVTRIPPPNVPPDGGTTAGEG